MKSHQNRQIPTSSSVLTENAIISLDLILNKVIHRPQINSQHLHQLISIESPTLDQGPVAVYA